MTQVTVALAKGRLSEKAIALFEKCGVDCAILKEPTRKLVLETPDGAFRFIFVKPTDVPTYVENGVADMGICGRDTLLEENKSVYEVLDLGWGKCKLCIAGYPGTDIDKADTLRVATKYVHVAEAYFAKRERNIEILKLSGSIELGPVIGLSDVILDIVESGKTLKENGLVVLRDVAPSSARLIVNKVSLKTKRDAIRPLVARMKEANEE